VVTGILILCLASWKSRN